jgi:acetolactate synthase-1/3 small subunit
VKHTISVLVENRFGVLARISGLFSSRGFNIDSLAVGETEDPTVSRMTIVVDGDEKILEQVTKQLNKLIDVIKVLDLTGEDFIDRELVLLKIHSTPASRSEILQIVDIFQARIIDVKPSAVTIEVTGNEHKIKSILDLLKGFGIKEMVRTGRIAISRTK